MSDIFFNLISGLIPTVLLGGFILVMAIPFIWGIIRFAIAIFPPKRK